MWTQEAHCSLEAHVSEGRSLSYLMKKTFVLVADTAGCLSKSNLPLFPSIICTGRECWPQQRDPLMALQEKRPCDRDPALVMQVEISGKGDSP